MHNNNELHSRVTLLASSAISRLISISSNLLDLSKINLLSSFIRLLFFLGKLMIDYDAFLRSEFIFNEIEDRCLRFLMS